MVLYPEAIDKKGKGMVSQLASKFSVSSSTEQCTSGTLDGDGDYYYYYYCFIHSTTE